MRSGFVDSLVLALEIDCGEHAGMRPALQCVAEHGSALCLIVSSHAGDHRMLTAPSGMWLETARLPGITHLIKRATNGPTRKRARAFHGAA